MLLNDHVEQQLFGIVVVIFDDCFAVEVSDLDDCFVVEVADWDGCVTEEVEVLDDGLDGELWMDDDKGIAVEFCKFREYVKWTVVVVVCVASIDLLYPNALRTGDIS